MNKDEIQDLYKQLKTLDNLRARKEKGSKDYLFYSQQIGKVMNKIRSLRSGSSPSEPSV
jgi:hypothetical protein